MHEIALLRRMFSFLRRIHIHPIYIILPIILSLLAASFEGIGMGLLIPLLEGFFAMDYSFMKETPLLGNVIALLPESFQMSDKLLFASLIGFFTIATLFKNILKYSSLLSISYVGLRATHHLRKLLFTRYLSFGKLYFDTSHVGHHNAVMSQFVQQSITPLVGIGRHINALFSLIVYLIILTAISWKLTLFAFPLLSVLYISVQRLIVTLRNLSTYIVKSINDLAQKTIEILSTISLVKTSNMERCEQDRYTAISDRQTRLDFKKSALQNLLIPLQETLTLFAILLLFSGMLLIMVKDGESAAPAFIVYFYLVMNAASKFGTLTTFRSGLANVTAAVDTVESVLDDNDKYFVLSGTKKFTGLQKSIEFRNMNFVFPNGSSVINNLSFEVLKGKMTAIVGQTGAGKTTIMNILLRLYDCQPTSIFVDECDIREYDITSLRNHIALVSQETLLLHDTLYHNIIYGLNDVSEERMRCALEQSRLSEFVQNLPEGLDTLIGDRGVKLSGGEKQRVSIARALLKGADILLLDEATSALDSKTERLIQEAIDEAIVGRTSIVIAHRLSTIKHADTIVVIDHGHAVEQGGLKELLDAGNLFAQMWEEQRFV